MQNFGFPDFFELTPDLVWIAGKDGFLKKVNPAVRKKLGYSLEELLSRPVSSFMHPDDVEITLLNRYKLIQGEVMHNFCNRYITKSGDIIWLEWTSIYLSDREIILAFAKDITVRKKIEIEAEEQYIKYKGLTSHFKNMMENDRKYFAYELHEELAQLVAVVNMEIGWLNMQTSGFSDAVKSKLEHTSAVCRLMIKTIQRLAFSISPQMLDEFGLNTTMEWLCSEFSVLHGIECSFSYDYQEQFLSHEIKLDFFRICQVALADILNHPEAGKIMVTIKDTATEIELLIYDNGKGFTTDMVKQVNGLKVIQERANSINGKIILQNNYKHGSAISLVIQKQEQPIKF